MDKIETIEPGCRSRRSHRRSGLALLYVTLVLSLLFAVASLAVDFGRVEIAKTELQTVVDSSARFGAQYLAGGADQVLAQCNAAAGDNPVAGQRVSFSAGDVEIGSWDASSRTFTPDANPQNAVRITRTLEVPLVLGKVIHFPACRVRAKAVAMASPSGYGFVGVKSVIMSGNSVVDSYNSGAGPYSRPSRGQHGDVSSNGSVLIRGNQSVFGSVYYGTSFQRVGNARIMSPGSAQKLEQTKQYDTATLPDSFINGGAFGGTGNGTVTLTSGNYYYTSFRTAGNFTLVIDGQVNLYVAGDVSMAGNFTTRGNLPGNFKINVIRPATVSLRGNSTIYADIDAPTSAVRVSGNNDFFGRVVGGTLTINGNAGLHYDEGLGGDGKEVCLVQ